MPTLDSVLAEHFNPGRIDDAAAAARGVDEAAENRTEAARRKLADCESRLGKYREALDSGADPAIVAGWMAEVQGERLSAEADLAEGAKSDPLTVAQLRQVVELLAPMAQTLHDASAERKGEIYAAPP